MWYDIRHSSRAHPASYSIRPVGKAAGTWSWPLASIRRRDNDRSHTPTPRRTPTRCAQWLHKWCYHIKFQTSQQSAQPTTFIALPDCFSLRLNFYSFT
jgi:hypothetical protein